MIQIVAILKFVMYVITNLMERDKVKKERKKAILREAKDAIRNKDTSAIVAALDRIRRV